MEPIYQTTIYNQDGGTGISYVEGGLKVNVSSPFSDDNNTNPEQLIGLAWATCLGATLKSILSKRGLKNPFQIKIVVKLFDEPITHYRFGADAFVSVKDLSIEEVKVLAKTAHKYCPVSKLIGDKDDVNLIVVPY